MLRATPVRNYPTVSANQMKTQSTYIFHFPNQQLAWVSDSKLPQTATIRSGEHSGSLHFHSVENAEFSHKNFIFCITRNVTEFVFLRNNQKFLPCFHFSSKPLLFSTLFAKKQQQKRNTQGLFFHLIKRKIKIHNTE